MLDLSLHHVSRSAVLVSVLAIAVGCVPTAFEDLRGEASTVALDPMFAPGEGESTGGMIANRRFGSVVTGYSGMIAGQFGSRVSATAGVGTPFTVYPLLIGTDLRLGTPTIDGCDTESPCDSGAGGSLVGMGVFRGRSMCVATAAMETGQIRVRCEDDATRPEIVPGPSSERFGFAGAGLRAAHPFGSALYGAPGALGSGGSVYRLGDTGSPTALDLSMGTGVGRELGRSVAIGIIDSDTVLVAGGAPVGSDKRVIVATVDIDASGAATTGVRGCMDATTRGYGEAVAIGDFDGDGLQDVAIGSGVGSTDDNSTPTRDNVVHIHSGADMAAPGSCVGAWPEATTLSCPESDGVVCANSSNFGAALSVGDINADGIDDLIVGAPGTEVDGVGSAGAVYVFIGNPALASLDSMVATLVHSSPTTGANLGVAVAAGPGQSNDMGVRRDEVIVGAPGANRVYVFLCSGIPGDSVSEFSGTRCQPMDN